MVGIPTRVALPQGEAFAAIPGVGGAGRSPAALVARPRGRAEHPEVRGNTRAARQGRGQQPATRRAASAVAVASVGAGGRGMRMTPSIRAKSRSARTASSSGGRAAPADVAASRAA